MNVKNKTKAILSLPTVMLKNDVIIPGSQELIFVAREKSMQAIDYAIEKQVKLCMVLQKNPEDFIVDSAQDLYSCGTVVKVVKKISLNNYTYKVLVMAEDRAKIEKCHIGKLEDPVMCEVAVVECTVANSDALENKVRELLSLAKKYKGFIGKAGAKEIDLILKKKDVSEMLDSLANKILSELSVSQEFLEKVDLVDRCQVLIDCLTQEVEVLKSEENIEASLAQKIDENKKKYYFSEKIRAIKKEMGEDSSSEDFAEKFRERIKNKEMPEDIRQKIMTEISKMESMSINAIDNIRSYLEWVTDMPWGRMSSSQSDHGIEFALNVLNKSHYGIDKVKEEVLEYIALQMHTKKNNLGSVLCLYGPPGIGKTSLAKSIAESMGRKYVKVSLNGIKDESEIKGHRRTYVGAMPGKIIQAIHKAGTDNPVILLDEVDKTGQDQRGDPQSALLDVLDSDQNKTFQDNFLEVEYDLSNVIFIATINSLNLQKPLLDRMEIVHLFSYLNTEKVRIAANYIVPKVEMDMQLKEGQFAISNEVLETIIKQYTKEAGVRSLERTIRKLFRKCLMASMCNNKKDGKVMYSGLQIDKEKCAKLTIKNVVTMLGKPKHHDSFFSKKDQVGVVNGLAYTSIGGDILPIEAVMSQNTDGKNGLKYTGNLGDVMKESVEIAMAYVRVNKKKLKITDAKIKNAFLHLHAPEGAVPKEGPSAGIAITTAIVSVLTGQKIKSTVAMTGEVTLSGNVLPIGGVREKLTSAYINGISEVIIPQDNKVDLDDLNEEVKKGLKIHLCSSVDKVLKIALV